MTATEWIRRTVHKVGGHQPKTKEAKLRAIADASRHRFPTADMDVMLREIEQGSASSCRHPDLRPQGRLSHEDH